MMRVSGMRRLAAVALVGSGLMAGRPPAAGASTPTPTIVRDADGASAGAAGSPAPSTASTASTAGRPARDVDPAQVAAIARELNCPLCQGYSLLDCPLQVCGQMRQLIADRLAQGWTAEDVRAQFVADYGPQILSAPPARGIGLAAWLGPALAALAGLGLLVWRRRSSPTSATAPASIDAPPAAAEEDHRRRLEALLDEEAG